MAYLNEQQRDEKAQIFDGLKKLSIILGTGLFAAFILSADIREDAERTLNDVLNTVRNTGALVIESFQTSNSIETRMGVVETEIPPSRGNQ